ncbi:MAG TPA: PKD domain-containing protein [Kineosporiaceae bacterium]|nr:PKD domain-containing protein [Kineosporiaceae bacterium]
MPLLGNLVRRPIRAAACAVAVVVLAQLNLGSAAAATIAGSPALLAAVGGTTYLDAVAADSPTNLWRLNDTAAGTSNDSAGTDNLTMDASTTRGTAGPMNTETSAATTFSGAGTVPATTSRSITGLQSFSVEAWFKTTSTTGGKIVGFGNSKTANSTDYDRHIFLTNAGNLTFGVYPTTYRYMTSPLTYNDGAWHQVVGTMNSTAMDLYVDGKWVAHDTSTAGAELYSGYWRIGGDNVTDWPGQPTKFSFAGSLADVAIYSAPLSLARVKAHYAASGRTVDQGSSPADGYGAAVYGDNPSIYWRLNETSGTSAKDEVSGDTQSGTYSAGAVLGEAGSSADPSGKSIRLPGSSAQRLTSNVQIVNPSVYSLETWFKTTSTQGGRLIGFGNSRTDFSSSYDRQIYLLDSGRLRYGIYTTQTVAIDSPLSYNDGVWHHVVATQGAGGEELFVDGVRVAAGTGVTPRAYTGYWRLGSDRVWDGASSESLAGSLDEAAVYPSVLSAETVQKHYQLGKPVPANVAPTAAFTSTVSKLKVSFSAADSADSDGRIASYTWDFGDGSTGTGVSPTHSYTAAGRYTVVLTVKDDKDAATLISHDVTAIANVVPTVAFSSACVDLVCTFDAAATTDSDGTIASYTWDFGDGGTGTGVTASHTYSAGTYTVTLKAADDDGASDSVTHQVTAVEPNQPPVAKFSSKVTDLSVAFDAAGSTDADGTITSYAWTFGDGSTGTGVTASHKYTAAGDYLVSVKVTDDDGATSTASATVTATDPIVAADTFTRAVTSGLGTAEIGGAWTVGGSAVTTSVVDGTGRISVGAARTNTFKLNSVATRDTDLVHTLWLEQMPSGGGATLWTTGRSTSAGDYRVRLLIAPGGTMTAQLTKVVGTAETVLTSAVTVPGGNYAINQRLRIRIQVFGASPTTIRAKIWQATVTEPTTWLASATDSTTGLQVAGSIGLVSNLLGTSTASIIRIDDVLATERTELVTNP